MNLLHSQQCRARRLGYQYTRGSVWPRASGPPAEHWPLHISPPCTICRLGAVRVDSSIRRRVCEGFLKKQSFREVLVRVWYAYLDQ